MTRKHKRASQEGKVAGQDLSPAAYVVLLWIAFTFTGDMKLASLTGGLDLMMGRKERSDMDSLIGPKAPRPPGLPDIPQSKSKKGRA